MCAAAAANILGKGPTYARLVSSVSASAVLGGSS